jgi:hypothetical protein
MGILHRNISPLQRRTIRLFGANLAITAGLALAIHDFFNSQHPATVLVYLLALLPTLPVIGIVVVVGRYLARETDEYIRMMVVQSLLWGLGVTFVTDTFMGSLFAYPSLYRIIPTLNIDLFCVTTGVALRIQLWRNR